LHEAALAKLKQLRFAFTDQTFVESLTYLNMLAGYGRDGRQRIESFRVMTTERTVPRERGFEERRQAALPEATVPSVER